MRLRVLLVAALCLVAAGAAPANVRPVSDAERAGVELAAAYMARGPAAVAEALSSDSPLHAVPKQLLATEIEARLGPAGNARWELVTVVDALKDRTAGFDVSYPSGVEESVFFGRRSLPCP